MAMPEQVFEPFGWENPMPTLPATQLPLKEQLRTGHIFAKCPMPLPERDNKSSNAPVQCELCLETLEVCRTESHKWHELQQRDAQIWKVRGISLKADGNTVPFPGKLPTPEHIAALGNDYQGGVVSSVSVEPADEDEADYLDEYIPPPPPIASNLATDKQVALLVRLAAEKTPEWFNRVGLEGVTRRAQERTKKEASEGIDKLIKMPTIGAEKQMKRGPIPAGRYCLPVVDGDDGSNDLAFYRVDTPTEGKWAGYTFVKRIIGGQTDENVPRNQAAGILARIKADQYVRPGTDEYDGKVYTGPEAGQMRYATETRDCWRCGTELTNLESRRNGIGPVCITKGN
jgi:hypothetical protein